MAAAVASGSSQYPANTFAPRTRTSPSAAIRISTPGTASPTVLIRLRDGRVKETAGESSVAP